jgi:hypothetical protein
MNRRGGIYSLQISGVQYDVKGNATYNLGRPVREAIIGADRVHGYKETPQAAFVELELTDRADLDLNALVTMTNVSVTLQLANGKVVALNNAWYAGDGTGNTEEGNIAARFESASAEEIST